MDETRNNDYRGESRNEGRHHNHNRNRGNRFRHGGGGHGGGGQPGRGRIQRPLLTSAINAAGLSFIALIIVQKTPELVSHLQCLGLAVVVFGTSSLVSYIAQRLRPKFIEVISDLLFLSGVVILIHLALKISGLL